MPHIKPHYGEVVSNPCRCWCCCCSCCCLYCCSWWYRCSSCCGCNVLSDPRCCTLFLAVLCLCQCFFSQEVMFFFHIPCCLSNTYSPSQWRDILCLLFSLWRTAALIHRNPAVIEWLVHMRKFDPNVTDSFFQKSVGNNYKANWATQVMWTFQTGCWGSRRFMA